MSQLRHAAGDLDRLGVKVAIITFQAGPLVRAYARKTELPWPILVDTDRALYRAYGMERGSLWAIWGPASWGVYIKLLLRGRRLELPAADVQQLGGDVLVDPQGRVRFHHVSENPADRPEVEAMLAVVRAAQRGPERAAPG